MNKQIEVLYKIFELELKPPFRLEDDPIHFAVPNIYNKFSEKLGWYNEEEGRIHINYRKVELISTRIKQVFNVDKFSNEDVYHIAKHLFNWFYLQDIFPKSAKTISIWNDDTSDFIQYPHK